MPKKFGFTLIELLVVITIIAILATIGLVIYSSSQKAARMVKRINDLHAIQTALELYYAKNNSYPTTTNGWRSECSVWGGFAPNDVIPGLVPTYMPAFPQDPLMNKSASQSCYLYYSNGTDYKLLDNIVAEFTAADYLSQRNLMDPARDGGSKCSIVDGTNPSAWALYSSATSACW